MYKINNIDDITVFTGNGNDLIDFARIIVKENEDVDFSVIGESDAVEYIEDYCDNLKLERNVSYKVSSQDILEQIKLQEAIQTNGINLVTCGSCGSTMLHRCNNDDDVKCPFCGYISEPCDFPDYFYSGMENNHIAEK